MLKSQSLEGHGDKLRCFSTQGVGREEQICLFQELRECVYPGFQLSLPRAVLDIVTPPRWQGHRGCSRPGTLFTQDPACLGLPLSTASYQCDKKNAINNNNDARKPKGSQEEGGFNFAEDLFPFPKHSRLHALLPVALNLRVWPLPRVRKRRVRELLLPQDVLTSWRFSSFTFSLSMTCKAKS